MRAHLAVAAATAAAAVLVAAPGTARAGDGGALVRYLPERTAEVIVLDISHARTGASVDKLVAELRAHSPRWAAVASGGVKLDEAIDMLVAGTTADGEAQARHTVMVVDGRVGVLLAGLTTDRSRATKHAGVTIWSIEGGEAAIVDHHLVLTNAGDMVPTIDRAHRRAAAGPQASVTSLDLIRAILAATAGTGADVWGGTILDARDRQFMAQNLEGEPIWVAFAIAVSVRASLDLRLAVDDEPTARAVETSLQRLLVGADAQVHPMLQTWIGPEFADSIAIQHERAEVRVTAAMSGDEAEQLAHLLENKL